MARKRKDIEIDNEYENEVDDEIDFEKIINESKGDDNTTNLPETSQNPPSHNPPSQSSLLSNNFVNNSIKANDTNYISPDEELENFLRTYPELETSKITIYRWKDNLNDWALVGTYNLKDFETTTDKIARKYGGGTYKFMIRNSKGQYVKQFTLNFDETAYPIKNDMGNIVVQNSLPDFSSFIKEYKNELKEQQNMLIQLMLQQQQQMTNLITTAISEGRKQKDSSELDMFMKAISIVKEFQKSNPTESIDKILEVFKAGMEIASTLQPESENSTFAERLITALLGNPSTKLAEVIGKMIEPTQNNSNQTINNPSNQLVNTNQLVNPNQQNKKIEIGGNMKHIVEIMAQKNINPEKIARTFLDSADDFTLNLIINLKDDREQIKSILIEYLPFLTKYPEWFEKLIDSLIKISAEYLEGDENDIKAT